jgi:alpha-L-fucosidase 2
MNRQIYNNSNFKILLFVTIAICCSQCKQSQNINKDFSFCEGDQNNTHIVFDQLPEVWDEAIPLGNGILGALIYKKGEHLRFSIDRIDLWDVRSTKYLDEGKHTFSYLYNLWKTGNYKIAQDLRDSLRIDPYPSKIPVAAIDFKNIAVLGKVVKADLSLKDAISLISWDSGTSLESFVAGDKEYGWFQFKNLNTTLDFCVTPPNYDGSQETIISNAQGKLELTALGYPAPKIERAQNNISYYQGMKMGNGYTMLLCWEYDNKTLTGTWTVVNNNLPEKNQVSKKHLLSLLKENKSSLLKGHRAKWENFWSKSSIYVPDSTIQTQWIKDMYKFGACTGISKIPISLQAIWTADNGRMPPWSGDFHHDFNTQASYWGAFNGNHLQDAKVFTDWLWKVKPEAEEYTLDFFETNGLAFPGVTDINGKLMVSWWQYTHSPTVSAWLGQYFYWYWRYSMDREFMKERAYPWIKDVTVFFDNFSVLDSSGIRTLPLSSSAEINDDSAEAWFPKTTNNDLAFIRWSYIKAIELAKELNKKEDIVHFKEKLDEWPQLAVSENHQLLIAPDYPLEESHRHLSHLVGIYPLGIVDKSLGEQSKLIINESLEHLDSLGTQGWIGFSFPWYSLLQARAGNGDKAAEYLKIFAENFCSPNSFHLNGDQSGKGYSSRTYRPFTLEANFAFTGAVNEMLLQSHTKVVEIFPAVPNSWKDIAFDNLRSQGAFLVSARKEGGKVRNVMITAQADGLLSMKNPFETTFNSLVNGNLKTLSPNDNGIVEVNLKRGDVVQFFDEK